MNKLKMISGEKSIVLLPLFWNKLTKSSMSIKLDFPELFRLIMMLIGFISSKPAKSESNHLSN
jgi:hypothetical protein